jgi:hypothetical protein
MTKKVQLLLLLLSSCSSETRTPNSGVRRASLSEGDIPGYFHTIGVSKFRPGQAPVMVSELGWNKTVGSDGSFSTYVATGAVMALPNAGAPSTLVAAFTADPNENNARVSDYFSAAGIPSDQVSGVSVTTEMAASGSTDDPTPPTPKFVAYASVLARSANGIRVVDSFAWARFNAKDEVVAEAVYWPTIPVSVVNDATDLSGLLADKNQASAYLAKLPPGGMLPGEVVIHHTLATARVPFSAYASYEVSYPGQAGRHGTRRFGIAGQQLANLPYSSTPPTPTKRASGAQP